MSRLNLEQDLAAAISTPTRGILRGSGSSRGTRMPDTPVGGERGNKEGDRDVRQRLRSPLHGMDSDGLVSPPIPEVHNIASPGNEPGIIMGVVLALFDEKLQPFQNDLKELKGDMNHLKNQIEHRQRCSGPS